ncbi:hypothetical protein V5799_004041 [Amblyomma americanum]|uniref:HTH CENPB-type domain-containing protein n=1 Tax=Amblyomma americanum TaxID=6943 RepID=A0AAQ4D789_AMBAM
MGKHLNSYMAGFKLKVVEFALEHGKRAASRKFDVDEKCVRRWCGQRDALKNTSSKKSAFRGKPCKFPELEEELLCYSMEVWNNGYALTTDMLRVRAQALARAKSIPHEDFKASAGWVPRFLKSKGLSFRRRTTLCQRLPPDYTDKVLSFQKYVIGLRREHNYIFSQIANADQTPVWFDCPESCTVELKGKKSVFVQTTGAERQRCTVMLCVTADGRKLPHYVILKRKTIPKGVFPKGIVVRAQEKGWMDDELVLDWVKSVWEKRPGAMPARRSLLVLDSFRGHLTGRVKERLRGIRTDMAVIPGGLNGMLQPLDVSVKRPFKVEFRRQYSEWMANGNHDETPTGRLKRAPLATVLG